MLITRENAKIVDLYARKLVKLLLLKFEINRV